jgi:hypothetical protein
VKKGAHVTVGVKGYVLIPKRLVTVCGAGYFHGDDPFKAENPASSVEQTAQDYCNVHFSSAAPNHAVGERSGTFAARVSK